MKLNIPTGTGEKLAQPLSEIRDELGHSEVSISALKINCEGCEWNLFAGTDNHTLSSIGQILTEFHFTTTLRFNEGIAKKYVQQCVDNLAVHFDIFHFAKNDGAWYDRHIDESIGIPTIPTKQKTLPDGQIVVTNVARCCSEMSLVNRNVAL